MEIIRINVISNYENQMIHLNKLRKEINLQISKNN